ncbi:MAG: N-acetylneuraminate synthase family protein [Alphaproteobacteria bacterium]
MHAYIDAISETGANAIKFQTHIAKAESTKDEKFRIPMSGQDATRYDYWKRMEFTNDQWIEIVKHTKEKGLIFLSSAFSIEAVELLHALDMPAWKVGSGEFRSQELLMAMTKTKKPILFSTGMSTYSEVDDAVDFFQKHNVDFGLFQCTSKYPTPINQVGLNVIHEYKEEYKCPVGLSDHTGSIHPALAAISQGADMLELHVTFDKRMYGPDTIASVTVDDLKLICDHKSHLYEMISSPVDKNVMAAELEQVRSLFTKSIALREPYPTGTIIEEHMIVPKKPGTGIPYSQKEEIVGMALKKDTAEDRLLSWEDLNT